MSVREAAECLVARVAALGWQGRTIPRDEMHLVIHALGGKYPPWLAELLIDVPLCGLDLGWREFEAEPDYDGLSCLKWSDARGILSESRDCYPGLAILPAGYVNVASCGLGTGNPYFISVHEGVDPPLYRIYHDVGYEAQVILTGGRIVVRPPERVPRKCPARWGAAPILNILRGIGTAHRSFDTQAFRRAIPASKRLRAASPLRYPGGMKVRDVLKLLRKDGWYRVSSRGGHRQLSTRPSQVVSPSPGRQVMTCRRGHSVASSNRPA